MSLDERGARWSTEAPEKKDTKVAIVQSSYIPWKGYFDLINMSDEFVLLDDVKYNGTWRNRNRILTAGGPRWLTIPVAHDHVEPFLRISDTRVADPRWARKHWDILKSHYHRAPCFPQFRDIFAEVYRELAAEERLSRINGRFITLMCELLGIKTRISWSMDLPAAAGKNERIIAICQALGATEYVSGPAAKVYIEPEQFDAAGIRLTYIDYSGYPEYPQLHGPFDHAVSIVDLIFNTGADAPRFMRSFGHG